VIVELGRLDDSERRTKKVVSTLTTIMTGLTILAAGTAAILAAPFLAPVALIAVKAFVDPSSSGLAAAQKTIVHYIEEYLGHTKKKEILDNFNINLEDAMKQTDKFSLWWDDHKAMFEDLHKRGGLRLEMSEATVKRVEDLKQEWERVRKDMDEYLTMVTEASLKGARNIRLLDV